MDVSHIPLRWLAAVALAGALAFAGACGGSDAGRRNDASRAEQISSSGGVTGQSPPGAEENAFAPADGDSDERVAAGGPPPGGDSLQSTLDRKIIQTATINLTTDNVAANFENVGNIAAGAGGFIASSSFGNNGDNQTASVTIRVPNDRYQDTLAQLRKLGDVQGEQSNANDVTEEFTDLSSRLRNLQATEARYTEFLTRAQTIADVLTVQDRLTATRGEIEQVQGRINLLEHQTDLATITVHLDPPVAQPPKPEPEGAGNPLEVAAEAFDASLAVLLGIATVALAVAAFSWWLVPLAAVGIYLGRRQVRTAIERRGPPPATGT